MEKFVDFELAKKLKEKGYPQVKKGTLAMYNNEGEWFSLATNLDKDEYSFEDFDDRDYVCPTIAQTLAWLREEHKLHVCIDLDTGTKIRKNDLDKDLLICMAKTPMSLSDNDKLIGRPTDFDINVKEVRISNSVKFLVVLTGNVLTMPGLSKDCAAHKIKMDESGKIEGLF